MDEIMRMVYRAIALDFFASGNTKNRKYIHEAEVQGDDPVAFPKGKVVKITVQYINEEDIVEDE
jgi:hypothetical protein